MKAKMKAKSGTAKLLTAASPKIVAKATPKLAPPLIPKI